MKILIFGKFFSFFFDMQIALVNVFASCLSLSERNVFYQNFIKILAQAMQFLFKLSFSNITLVKRTPVFWNLWLKTETNLGINGVETRVFIICTHKVKVVVLDKTLKHMYVGTLNSNACTIYKNYIQLKR